MPGAAIAVQSRPEAVVATPVAGPTDFPLRFSAGSRRRSHGVFYDESLVMQAGSRVLPEAPVPPGDWLASMFMLVDVTTAGNAAAVALTADAPWSVISQIDYLDPAGNSIYSLSGFGLYLANLLGGFAGQTDPALSPYHTALTTGPGATAGSGRFVLPIPIEIVSRDAVGALPNGASNAVTRVRLTLAPLADLYAVAPTVAPTVRIRIIEEGYVLPSDVSPAGNSIAQQPPGAGTFQQWSESTIDFGAGKTRKEHARKGNVYRTLILVARTAANVRSNTVLDELAFAVDDVASIKGPFDYLRHRTWDMQGFAAASLPTGVVQVSYAHEWDGRVGGELRDWWVQTQPGSSVFFDFQAAAPGKLQVITNEVVPMSGTGVLRV